MVDLEVISHHQDRPLIKDSKWIDEDYIPSTLHFRDLQIQELDYLRRSIIDDQRPSADTLLMGSTGTGKTALLRDLLAKTRSNLTRAPNLSVKSAYLDCNFISNERTFWVNLASELKVYFTATTSLDQVRSNVMEVLTENLLLIMLDEIDTLMDHPMVLDSTTNTLARAKGVTIVAAANRKDWKKGMSIKNTFNPRTIHLPEYNYHELINICQDRIDHGLRKNSVDSKVVEILARRAHRVGGDARKLIKMLKISVEQAEMNSSKKVTVEHANYAIKQIDDESNFLIDSLVNKSHDIHVILLAIHQLNYDSQDNTIEEEFIGVRSGDIIVRYSELIKRSTEEDPLKYRSIMDLTQKLLSEALIIRTRARTRGNVWFYEINDYISGKEIERILKRICAKCNTLIEIQKVIQDLNK